MGGGDIHSSLSNRNYCTSNTHALPLPQALAASGFSYWMYLVLVPLARHRVPEFRAWSGGPTTQGGAHQLSMHMHFSGVFATCYCICMVFSNIDSKTMEVLVLSLLKFKVRCFDKMKFTVDSAAVVLFMQE